MSYRKALILVTMFLIMVVASNTIAIACSTCGCSELCPLTMMQESEHTGSSSGLLSESIWGSVILKMAYQRDPQLQKLTRHKGIVNGFTSANISAAIGGTLGQNIISLATLNPPEGQSDSYLPGSLGLGLSGLVNVVFDANILANWHLSKKIKARQLVVRGQVESILDHLEHSQASCPKALDDLAQIVGERAASDCIKLWQLSHAATAASTNKIVSEEQKPNDNSDQVLLNASQIVSSTQVPEP
jgi:hypothetical protein